MRKKQVRTPFYNYNFNIENGLFVRWGKNLQDDPQYSPIGLEILDIEVSTICHKGCPFCYKSNLKNGENMTLGRFKEVIDCIKTLTQVAFGIGDIDGNPDLFKMFDYCRDNNIVPNLTINGARMTDEYYDKLAKYCGAVAVSHYDKDECYNAVEELTNRGMEQVNIHQLISEETYEETLKLLKDIKDDIRLAKLNAVVFLSLKQKGRGESHNIISPKHFRNLIDICFEKDISFGFDSCTALKFLHAIEGHENYDKIKTSVEPCESGLFSSYINVDGVFFPCSFAEGLVEGIEILKDVDFLQDIWYNPLTIEWRNNLLDNCRNCPIYNI